MLLKLKAMLIKELKQMLRDPKMRMVVLGIPTIQMLVMSFAMTLDVKNINVTILDFDKSSTTYEIAHKMNSSGFFKIESYANSLDEVRGMLDNGEVRGAIVFEAGTQEKIYKGQKADVQVIADGTMSNDAGIIFSYMSSIISEYNMQNMFRLTGKADTPVEFTARALYNENLDSRFYYVPGIITMMILVTSILLTSIAIVREKEIGTIEQVMVTPIGKFEFIIGKTLPFFITGIITTTIMLTIAFLAFDIVVKGSIFTLGLVVSLNILSYLGLALLISSASYTQQQALLTAFFILMPFSLLSGFLFPIDNMPMPIQYLTYLDPMRWGFESITGVIIKGAGIRELSTQIQWQIGHAVFFLTFASFRFRKTME
ncbi:MAG: ABC transporter permease [Denitrovibrio sp.]|nr:MAG: ABC transporter permease [Denitrovibrio sp.]